MVCDMFDYIDPTSFNYEDSRAMDIYKALLNTNEAKGKLFICGNGGSASTASHFQSDLNKAFEIWLR